MNINKRFSTKDEVLEFYNTAVKPFVEFYDIKCEYTEEPDLNYGGLALAQNRVVSINLGTHKGNYTTPLSLLQSAAHEIGHIVDFELGNNHSYYIGTLYYDKLTKSEIEHELDIGINAEISADLIGNKLMQIHFGENGSLTYLKLEGLSYFEQNHQEFYDQLD